MRVLLISPVPALDTPGGDVTYTQTLLAHPPEGVQYETYAQALERGTLQQHGNRRALKARRLSRIGATGELALTGAAYAINSLRRAKLLFWEPFHFFSAAPGAYDLIHMNVFSARILNPTCPIIVSNAIPLRYLYTAARHYSLMRVRMIEHAEKCLGRLLKVNINSYQLPQASRVIAFTRFLSEWYIQRKVVAPAQVDVVPIYLPAPAREASSPRPAALPRRIGFVAKAFKLKGGPVLLAAFEIVRQRRPDAELCIIGSEPELAADECRRRNITWLPYLERERMLSEVLPTLDVFAYPTEFDGLPLVVLEAMSHGIAIAASDFQALPEILDDGRAGKLSPVGDPGRLAENILDLLEPGTNLSFRRAARDRFDSYYSADVVRPKLRTCYEQALRDQPHPIGSCVGKVQMSQPSLT